MPRPRDFRRSKLRDNDADDTNNRIGCWSTERLIKMDRAYCAEVRRLSALYRFPRTAREAHLLFNHDRRRIIDSFRWVLSMQPFEGPIVDFGCGTGTLLRLIPREHRDSGRGVLARPCPGQGQHDRL
jgi:hypothetical protein